MKVENSSANPGDVDHVANVTGSFSEEIFGYYVRLQWSAQVAGDIDVTNVTLDGCVAEGAMYFTWS